MRDPPEFDDTLLQTLEQKRQELDAKVARYITKKQGQFNDYVAEKHRRYDLRADDRQKRRAAAQQERDHEAAIVDSAEDASSAKHLNDDDAEAAWFTKQREAEARTRAELVSEEVAKSGTRARGASDAGPQQEVGSVRERDSEILQLLPGFLPLLEDQEQLSSSAPAANRGDGRAPRNPRSELVRSSTMPPTLKHSPAPRRSSLKQSNGDRPGSARKAVRLSLGPRIVTPTQSPPDDRPSTSNAIAHTILHEETLRTIQKEIEEAERWRSEPERVYTEEIPIEDLLSATSVSSADETSAPNQLESPAPASPDKGKEKAQPTSNASNNSAIAAPEKEPSPSPSNRPSYSASPLNFGKEEIPPRAPASAAGGGRRSSLTEEAKSAPKEPPPKKKKKKKAKTVHHTSSSSSSASTGGHGHGLATYTPARSHTTTALSSTAPEVGTASSARSIAHKGGNQQPSSSTSLLSSSFVDANNTGIFYPTRTRPPASQLRPDEASLSAVNVPLPVGGFSSGESPPQTSSSYAGGGSMMRGAGGASLGESYMALNFARRMAEKEMAEKKKGGEKGGSVGRGRKPSRSGPMPQGPPVVREEDEEEGEDQEEDGGEAERLARVREEKYRRDRMLDDDEFAGELDL